GGSKQAGRQRPGGASAAGIEPDPDGVGVGAANPLVTGDLHLARMGQWRCGEPAVGADLDRILVLPELIKVLLRMRLQPGILVRILPSPARETRDFSGHSLGRGANCWNRICLIVSDFGEPDRPLPACPAGEGGRWLSGPARPPESVTVKKLRT